MSDMEFYNNNCQEFFRELKVDLERGIKVRLDNSLSDSAKECASIFDKNNDDVLDKNELHTFLDVFYRADMNGDKIDGKLSDIEIDKALNNYSSRFKDYSVKEKKQMLVEVYTKVLAQEIKAQIDGPSINDRTIARLEKIGANNILEVLKEYDRISPDETLASAIDNEWGLNIQTVKKYICKPLVNRAIQEGVKQSELAYEDINNIKDINKFIENTIANINSAKNRKTKPQKTTAAKAKGSTAAQSVPPADKNTITAGTKITKPTGPIDLNNKEKALSQIKELIKQEVMEKIIKEQGVKSYKVDLDYWSQRIYNVAKKNNFPAEIIITIISTESRGKFEKNCNKDGKRGSGYGPTQVTKCGVDSFFPNSKGTWNDIAQIIDNNLLNEIVYTKNNKLMHSSSISLRNACAANDEYGIKVGVMIFEMKYIEAVVQAKYGLYPKKNPDKYYPKVKEVAQQLRNGTLVLTDAEKQKCMSQAFFLYNGNDAKHPKKGCSVQENYKREATDTIKRSGYNFKIVPIKTKKA